MEKTIAFYLNCLCVRKNIDAGELSVRRVGLFRSPANHYIPIIHFILAMDFW